MKPATERQVSYVMGLLENAMLTTEQRTDISRRLRQGLTHADCVEIIPILQVQQRPRPSRPPGPGYDPWDYYDFEDYRDSFDGIAGHPMNHGSH